MVGEIREGVVDSGGQGWGDLAALTFLNFNCDPHSPQRLITEALLFTTDLPKASGPAGGWLSEIAALEREINLN